MKVRTLVVDEEKEMGREKEKAKEKERRREREMLKEKKHRRREFEKEKLRERERERERESSDERGENSENIREVFVGIDGERESDEREHIQRERNVSSENVREYSERGNSCEREKEMGKEISPRVDQIRNDYQLFCDTFQLIENLFNDFHAHPVTLFSLSLIFMTCHNCHSFSLV